MIDTETPVLKVFVPNVPRAECCVCGYSPCVFLNQCWGCHKDCDCTEYSAVDHPNGHTARMCFACMGDKDVQERFLKSRLVWES